MKSPVSVDMVNCIVMCMILQKTNFVVAVEIFYYYIIILLYFHIFIIHGFIMFNIVTLHRATLTLGSSQSEN